MGERIGTSPENHRSQNLTEEQLLALRSSIEVAGVGDLAVSDLTADDVERIDWSGSSTHLRYVSEAIDRVASGEVEYLAIRGPDGTPVAKGGIDYAKRKDGAELWQLATHPRLQGLGLGTKLVADAEGRIRNRGVRYAYLGVEDENPEARKLYERLGYMEVAREKDSWDQEDEQGKIYRYETEVAIMRKDLSAG